MSSLTLFIMWSQVPHTRKGHRESTQDFNIPEPGALTCPDPNELHLYSTCSL